MIPNVVISVEAMPLSSSGKLLRRFHRRIRKEQKPRHPLMMLSTLLALLARRGDTGVTPEYWPARGREHPELLVQLPRMGGRVAAMDDDDLVSVWSSSGRLPLATA